MRPSVRHEIPRLLNLFLPLFSDSLHRRASNCPASYIRLLLAGISNEFLPVSSPKILKGK